MHPQDAELKMKNVRNEDKSLVFQPSEWLKERQIKSFFSRRKRKDVKDSTQAVETEHEIPQEVQLDYDELFERVLNCFR